MKNATAVMDASIAYGASRWYRGLHQDPKWEYAHKYNAEDDLRLYYEFLHSLLLYDRIVLDKSSVSSVGPELQELFTKINIYLGKELLSFDRLTDASTLEPVQRTICALIKGVIEDGIKTESNLAGLRMPWAYYSPHHHDYKSFMEHVRDEGLASTFVPLAIYAYRGICYSGFANGLSEKSKLPTIYLASPGRMKVLAQLLDVRDVTSLRYPLVAYRDLVRILKLPSNGYRFSHIRSVPASQLSDLTLAIDKQKPRDSLKFVLQLRGTSESTAMRKEWAERIWARGLSSSVGSEGTQSVTDSTISGSLTMIQIHGVAID